VGNPMDSAEAMIGDGLVGRELFEAIGRTAPHQVQIAALLEQLPDPENRIVPDEEIKREIAEGRPYGEWYRKHSVHLDDLPEVAPKEIAADPLHTRQLLFGYTQEDVRITLAQMGGAKAEEPLGSMGNDFALAVLSDKAPPLYSYFKQLFAQVTNPPIDPIREKIVMSLSTAVGPQGNLLDETPEHAHQLVMSQPLLTPAELEKLRQVDHSVFRARTLDATWPVEEKAAGLERALERLCREASEARSTTRPFRSSSLPSRLVGVQSRISSPVVPSVARVIFEGKNPGQMAFTLTLWRAHSSAMQRVMWATAALDMQ